MDCSCAALESFRQGLGFACIVLGTVLILLTAEAYISWRLRREKSRHFDLGR